MRFSALLIWYIWGAIAAIAIAWLAALIHASGHAPVGLTSLGVGAALGAALSAIAATGHRAEGMVGVAGRRHLIIGTIVLSILAVFAEHAWLYRDFRGQWREARAKTPEVALFRPESPWSPREYFTREFTPEHAVLWTVDAAIITAVAVGAVTILQRVRK